MKKVLFDLESIPHTTDNNHYKGLNLKKEIFNYKKKENIIKTEIEFRRNIKGSNTIKNLLEIKKISNIQNNSFFNTEEDKKSNKLNLSKSKDYNRYLISNKKEFEDKIEKKFLTTFSKEKIDKKEEENLLDYMRISSYSVFKKLTQDKYGNIKTQFDNEKRLKTTYSKDLIELKKERLAKETFRLFPTKKTVYSLIDNKKKEFIEKILSQTRHRVKSKKNYTNKTINNEYDKLLESKSKKSSIYTDMLPVAYVHESDFKSYSEANRYQKLLQEISNLQYLISQHDQKHKLVDSFFEKIDLLNCSALDIQNFIDNINENEFTLDPNKSLKDNIKLIIDFKSGKNIDKKILNDNFYYNKSNNYIENDLIPLKHRHILSKQDIEREEILKLYKKSPHEEVNKENCKDFDNIILNLEKSLNQNEIKLITTINQYDDYFNSNQLYQKSMCPIPTSDYDLTANQNKNLQRTNFCRKKKLLEYVYLKELKHNKYYLEEGKTLENDVKFNLLKMKQLSTKKKQSINKFNL